VAILVICTGNAARSVMAGFMLEHLARARGVAIEVVTAGTHTVDGQPMSMRTRDAIDSIGQLHGAALTSHRSRQLVGADVRWADLVVGMEADHVRYVRSRHPEGAARTATLRRLAHDLPERGAPLPARLAALDLAGRELDDADDVIDPAGREGDFYRSCAWEIWELSRQLVSRL
jgi:protein-tyrosine phosphatase